MHINVTKIKDNLVSHGKLFFSEVNEKGVGATSPLWVFLLAGFKLLGIPMLVSAKMMGVLGLIAVSGGIYVLFRPVWKSPSLLLAVFLLSISGNLLWFSLSGMETMLFLATGILALIAYREERLKTCGILLGLMTLIRPEGIILVGGIVLVDLWAHRICVAHKRHRKTVHIYDWPGLHCQPKPLFVIFDSTPIYGLSICMARLLAGICPRGKVVAPSIYYEQQCIRHSQLRSLLLGNPRLGIRDISSSLRSKPQTPRGSRMDTTNQGIQLPTPDDFCHLVGPESHGV